MGNRLGDYDVRMKHNEELVQELKEMCAMKLNMEKKMEYLHSIKTQLTGENNILKKSVQKLNGLVKVLMIMMLLLLLMMIYFALASKVLDGRKKQIMLSSV